MVDYDEQEKRIAKVLGNPDKEVTSRSLGRYMKYIKEYFNKPCILTGIEDFSWEEKYVFGNGDKKEYEKLKKTQPSYTDKYEIIDFEDTIDDFFGIMVKAKRMEDNKEFILPLADLEVIDKKQKNYELFDDYSVWFVNNR